jgi:hypothetical protein
MPLDLIGEGTISADADQAIPAVFEGLSCPNVLQPVHGLIMLWAVNENANTRS